MKSLHWLWPAIWCMAPPLAQAQYAAGTGFFITADGYFVTCLSAVEGAKRITLKGGDGSVDAELVATDRATDLALLKARGNFAPLSLAAEAAVRTGAGISSIAYLDPENVAAPNVTRGVV